MYLWRREEGGEKNEEEKHRKGDGSRKTEIRRKWFLCLCENTSPKSAGRASRLEPQARANPAVLVSRPSGWLQNSLLLLELSVFFSSDLQLIGKAYPHHHPQDSLKNTHTETLTVMFHHIACSTAQPSQ